MPTKPIIKILCLQCRTELQVHRSQRKFCNVRCRMAWHYHKKTKAKTPRQKWELADSKATRAEANASVLRFKANQLKTKMEGGTQ